MINMSQSRSFLVTGGAGFIGSHMVDMLLENQHKVIVLDACTYAANASAINDFQNNPDIEFIQGNIANRTLISSLLADFSVDIILNFAAETHVDNSIQTPEIFLRTNIFGTYELLTAAMEYWQGFDKPEFKFIQISTDEVFGEVGVSKNPFSEDTAYAPRSPYSASKASSDHLVRSWYHTYKLPTLVTHCSNNFGPRQNSEKLVPKIISNAISGKEIPIYGDGQNTRDWLYVGDHCAGILLAAENGLVGESYCFGGDNQYKNIDLAKKVCLHLDKIQPSKFGTSYVNQIRFVADRKGHDRHYAVDFSKAANVLGYSPKSDFNECLNNTIMYYLNEIG